MNKRKFAGVILICLIFGILVQNVFADEVLSKQQNDIEQSENITQNEIKTTSSKINVIFDIGLIKNFKMSVPRFELYNTKNELLATSSFNLSKIGESVLLSFNVEEYNIGDKFYLKCLNDVDCILYNGIYYGVNSRILLETTSENPDTFKMVLYPQGAREFNLFYNSKHQDLTYPLQLVDDNIMICLVDVMNIYGLWNEGVYYDNNTKILTIKKDDKFIEMTQDSLIAKTNQEITLECAPLRLAGMLYLPMKFTMEELGSSVGIQQTAKKTIVSINKWNWSKIDKDKKSEIVNSRGLKSKTGYLIWVCKSDFTVSVFENVDGVWKTTGVYPCSIGKSSTPTITGQFEYFSKENKWSYPSYYVGPIMRFYSGYALHSTLIRYDETPYNATLGEKISLGCVRMKPEDIKYLWDTIPLNTKVYVSEE